MGVFQHWVRCIECLRKEKKKEKSNILCWEPGTINPSSLDIASEYIQTSLRILWIMYCSLFFFFNPVLIWELF